MARETDAMVSSMAQIIPERARRAQKLRTDLRSEWCDTRFGKGDPQ